MDDQIKVIEVINNHINVSQRLIGKLCNFSTGKVNYIINQLIEEGLVSSRKKGRRMEYFLTEKGIEFYKSGLTEYQLKKINIHKEPKKTIQEAIILAAGETNGFDKPVSLLPLDETNTTLIDRNIEFLKRMGIKKIIMVVGHKKEEFQYLSKSEGIILVENPKYRWTGSMASLACAQDFVTDDFLLVEHDILIEESAFQQLIEDEQRDCMLISSETGSGDEAFVEIRDNYIYKISKDIHQMNRVDGEMVGISKISFELYSMMLEEYRNNRNPLLNYEYLLLDVSRQYNIGYLKINDLVWSEIDTPEHYENIVHNVLPRLKRKESDYKEDYLKEVISEALQVDKSSVLAVEPFGGMTNKNYRITMKNQKQYVLRMPGKGTGNLINRINEKRNSALASQLGIDSELKYFDENTGIKVSLLIPNAETLNPKSAKWEANMRLTASILKKLHNSDIKMENIFDISEMMNQYENLIIEVNGTMYPNYDQLKKDVLEIKNKYDEMNIPLRPCHNDTVPENFVKSGDDKIYLIDWEYSGLNDPVWDLAAHSLESGFSEKEEELLLNLYFPEGVTENIRTRMLMHKIFQDFIWSLWTVYKEAEGDDFGDYGINRHNRAIENTKKLLSKGIRV